MFAGAETTLQRIAPPTAWALVGGAWLTALLITGSTIGTVALWVLVVVTGIVVPGIALVRAVRPAQAALIEDIGWGVPAGCLVAMVGWAVGVVSPVGAPPWVVGPILLAILVTVPATRSRVLAPPAPGWGTGANLLIAGVLLVVIGWMTADYLRLAPPYPAPEGTKYDADSVFQLAVVGGLQHSLDLQYPLVAGEQFSYHWFANAVLAHLLDGGPERFDAVIRLAPATLLPAVIITAAVVARTVAGRIAAGPLAAALIGVAGTTVATWQADGFSVPVFQTYWWASLTTAFGWLAALAVAGTALALIRGGAAGSATPVALFLPFAVLAVGAKASNLAVLLGGAGLAVLALLLARRPARRALTVFVALGAVLLLARITIYGSGGYGLRPDVFGTFERNAALVFPGLTGARSDNLAMSLPEVSTVAVLAGLLLYFLPLVPRLVGLALLDLRDAGIWFFLGTLIAALGAMAVFRHPAQSESFFLISAYPVLIVGSAWGLARGWDRISDIRPAKALAAVAVGIAIGFMGTLAIATLAPPNGREALQTAFGHPPTAADMSPLWQAAYMLAPLATVAALLTAAAVAALLWVHQDRARRPVAATVLVAAVLGTGLLSTGVYLTSAAPTLGQDAALNGVPITRDEVDASRWLAAHSAPTEVYATNRVCAQDQPGPELPEGCGSKISAVSALAGRTAYVGGWAYASRNLDTAWDATIFSLNLDPDRDAATSWWSTQPFWNPELLARQQAAFIEPTPQLLDELARAGVRWMVADSRGAPTDETALDTLALRRFSTPTVTVWELPPHS